MQNKKGLKVIADFLCQKQNVRCRKPQGPGAFCEASIHLAFFYVKRRRYQYV